jgi:S1-C subfamily serine protease
MSFAWAARYGLGRVTALSCGATAVLAGALSGCTSSGGSSTSSATPAPQLLQSSYEQVVQHTLPSVVRIDTSSGLGSGVVLDTQGDIVTNAHVIGTATTVTVTLSTDDAVLPAKLLDSFPQGDLAVIKLDAPPPGLDPAVFADSSKLTIGQIVLAMGNPLGLSSSVTQGIVSATGRTVSEPATASSPGATLTDMVQTSAAINPGNSGGALVDLSGRVVGIPTLAAVDQSLGGAAPGIGFAIASNTAKNIADQIVTHGKVVNSGLASLDITARTVTDQSGKPLGVGVVSVTSGGAAAKAGIVPGDVITAVNGTATPSTAALSETLAGLRPGQQVPVNVTHADGSTATVTATLGTLAVS